MKIRRQSWTFQVKEDPFSKNAEGISKIYHKVTFLQKLLQTKPRIKSMNNNCHDLYYTVVKNRDDEEIKIDENQNIEIDYNDFDDFKIPNHCIGRKNDKMI